MRRVQKRYGRSAESKDQLRNEAGEYAHRLDRLCKCGHAKGVHLAGERGRSAGECIAHEFNDGPVDRCSCEKFRAAPIKK